jgi:hypothetical protein
MVDGAVLTLDGTPFLMADVGRWANEGRNRDGAKTVDGAVLTLDGAPLLMEMSAMIRDLVDKRVDMGQISLYLRCAQQITEICVSYRAPAIFNAR